MGEETQQETKQKKSFYKEWIEPFLIAAVVALFIRQFVVEAFKIPSGSMIPTLTIGDHLLVNKFLYGPRIPFTDIRFFSGAEPKRGDIIVFKFPEDESKNFIKRVVGTPGDVVEGKDKKVFVNGKLYVNPHEVHKEKEIIPKEMNPRDTFGPVTVPPDSYFMMGDNRDRSYDSRFWGFVKRDKIKGLAFIKYWSWDREKFRPRLGSIGNLIN